MIACIAVASAHSAFASNPALDVSQHVHTAWKIREGFTRGSRPTWSVTDEPD
ncbi:MAG TPA: hypothetical protein VKE51_34515 [Vicinamibacterales bacterium]|nr:hypothetical protein [Vicinamibacterales bacterium]